MKNPEAVNPPLAAKKVIVFGSSIAAGIGASHDSLSWVGLLKQKRKQDNFINYSIPGTTTFHYLPNGYKGFADMVGAPKPLANNIDKILENKPDLVIISLTTNDISLGYTPDQYMQNMRIMTNLFRSYKIPFIITSATIREDISLIKRKLLVGLSGKLRSQYGLEFVDILTPLADTVSHSIKREYYTKDLIHPNDFGHAKIFLQIMQHAKQRAL